jgi:hypothetical protein
MDPDLTVMKWKEHVTRNQMRGPAPNFSAPGTNSKNKQTV